MISGTNQTLQYMAARGVETFSDINPRLVKDYIESLRGIISPQALAHRLQVLELVWIFREDMLHPEAEHPWMERKLSTLLPEQNGSHLAGRRCTTPVIPPSVQAAMFDCAEAKVSGWKALLDRRDAGELSDFSYKVAGPRGAALYLVQISGGLRNSEAVGIKNGCLRRDKIGDEEVFWITTVEHKTSKGEVDYIVPGELLPVLELLQRFAAPYQAALRREIQCLQHLLGTAPSRNRVLPNGMRRSDALTRLSVAQACADNLFLERTNYHKDGFGGYQVTPMSSRAGSNALKKLAAAAGVDWDPDNRQCRRTYAWNVANSRLGRFALVFAKWQLKHASINWTQAYAANPRQDPSLYGEFMEEMVQARVEILQSWFDSETPLSGGAGREIMAARATRVPHRGQLLRYTAETATVRSTGHSWCISEDGGCVAGGLYDREGDCVDCGRGVIDESFAETWKQIHLINLQLLRVNDCGPSALTRARQNVEASEKVLRDLGIDVSAKGE